MDKDDQSLKLIDDNKLLTLISSYRLSNYGKLVSEESYVEHYNVHIDDDSNNKLAVGYLKGSVKKTDNLGNYNNITYSSEISIPFMYDPSNPESEGNKFRILHAYKIRDYFLEADLAMVKELCLEEVDKNIGKIR